MEKVKEYLGKLGDGTKKLIIAGAVIIIAFAVIMGLVLNSRSKTYDVLFTGINSEEAKQIIGKLQADGISYQYENDDILVPVEVLDTTKAKLVSEGFPKSGFTYNVFKDNVSMMTTDTDRKTFKIYELETRIGSTIQIFDGVKEAYVTLALGEEQRYALEDSASQETSAQAVVVMKDGGSPTEEQAKSIQRLISRSVPGMVIENVSVFDGNGREVSVATGEENVYGGKESEEIATMVENQISAKIMNVLGGIYGNGNVRVAVKAKVNMEKLLRESVTYNTPEKIDENDKTGIISEDSKFEEFSGDSGTVAGVAGTEANADIPQYTNQEGEGGENAYWSNSETRKFLVNQIKEQGQIDPGALEDLTVSVAINGEDFGGVQLSQLQSLIGNAAGIAVDDRAAKIAVVSTPFFRIDVPEPPDPPVEDEPNLLPWIILSGVLGFLVILLIVILLIKRKKKKKLLKAEAQLAAANGPAASAAPEINEEAIDIDNEKGMELRDSIRDFTDQNPEISAQLLKNWLNGGDHDGD